MSSDDEPNMTELRSRMQDALRAQAASALHYTLVAGTLQGIAEQSVSAKCEQFADMELQDTRALVDKAVSLGCDIAVGVGELKASPDSRESLSRLRAAEADVIATLHAVIPETGQFPWSEALEHLLEHVIMRKQQQVDFLSRALGER